MIESLPGYDDWKLSAPDEEPDPDEWTDDDYAAEAADRWYDENA